MADRSAAARRRREPEEEEVEDVVSSTDAALEPVGASTDLDRLIHERVRLAIISALAVNDSLGFTELKQLLDVSDGNLSVHARKLEEAGYIECKKSFRGRVPHTDYIITPSGRAALEHYLEHMEALIRAVREV